MYEHSMDEFLLKKGMHRETKTTSKIMYTHTHTHTRRSRFVQLFHMGGRTFLARYWMQAPQQVSLVRPTSNKIDVMMRDNERQWI